MKNNLTIFFTGLAQIAVMGLIIYVVLSPIIGFVLGGMYFVIRKLKQFFKPISKNRAPKEPHITIGEEALLDSERLRHTHILGSTGSGKTVLLENLIYADLARGNGMFIIDPKGDRDLYDRVRRFCKNIGRSGDLHYLSVNHLEESSKWNPCRLGSPSEIQSKFLNSWEFSEPYYAKACEAYLLEALNSLGGKPFNLLDLSRKVEELSLKNKEDAAKALHLDLQNTINGEWGAVLSCDNDNERHLPELNLLDVIRKNEILFVDLPTEGKSIQSTRIGKLLLQELIQISGYRKTHPHLRNGKPFSVYIDEFDAFATPSFATFLNKARSSDFMIHIAHQTLSDLKKVDQGQGWFMGQILGNVNNRFIFRTDDPEDAEQIASIFGTKLTQQYTRRVSQGFFWSDVETGEGSMREVYEFRVHPNKLKELATGFCIFGSKTSGRLKQLKVPLPNPEKYYQTQPLLRSGVSLDKEAPKNDAMDRIDVGILSKIPNKPFRNVKMKDL